jgi:hypothetical protein
MPMRLRRTTVLPRVEKCKQPPGFAISKISLPFFQTGIRHRQISFLKLMGLRFIRLGREDEVFGYYWELVQNYEVRRCSGRYIGYKEVWIWGFEWVVFLFGGPIMNVLLWRGFFG